MRRPAAATVSVVAVLAGFAAGPVAADPPDGGPFPALIDLPAGIQPEGISAGPGTTFYVGSIPTGAVYRGDLRTGEVEADPVVAGQAGRAAIGTEYADGLLFVAGGNTGDAFVYDAATGADVAVLTLTGPPTFVNDVVVTREAAFFTDSVNPVVYRVDRETLAVTVVPLTGDLVYGPGFNVNGIDATPDGGTLVLVQSNTGRLFTADPRTGVTREIALADGESVPMGDGILLHGRTLYVVQNRLNLVAEVRLSGDLSSGTIVGRTGDPGFDVPTTIARSGSRLYAVNARFGTPNPATASYTVVGLPRR